MYELPAARSVERNPSQARLRELALGVMPRLQETEYGNLNYTAQVTARLKNSTFFAVFSSRSPLWFTVSRIHLAVSR